MNAPKHRRRIFPVTHGYTAWPKHRDPAAGPAPADGMEEYQAKWVAAMKVREAEIAKRLKAVCN